MDNPQATAGKFRVALAKHREIVKEILLAAYDDYASLPGPDVFSKPLARRSVAATIDNLIDDLVR